MSERRAKGCIVAAIIWCVILGVLAVGYKFLVHPYLSEKLKGATSSENPYKNEIIVAADSFSGYSILRSEELQAELRSREIRLTIEDDNADYAARLKALRKGDVHMAVFTIDSLITASVNANDFPASIVLLIDETNGGDAIVAKKSGLPSVQQLNHPDARLVLTPSSPSEFLARVVIAHFNLPQLPTDWAVEADGAEDVYKMFRSASPGEKRAYVLWEPYVSKALQEPDAHVLLDTSKLKGYIVDVLVAQREFLRDHPGQVKAVIEAYCRANYTHEQKKNGMVELVQDDAKRAGAERLNAEQAAKIVQGIQWKNTLENYAHFGLTPRTAGSSLPLLEDIIGNIVDVLVKTKALSSDPLDGKYHTLYYDKTLAEMKNDGFHPGRELNLISGLNTNSDNVETVRSQQALSTLTPEQWNNLQPVGELNVAPVVFARGSARITIDSKRDLQSLAKRLQTFPRFYLRVLGHTRSEGDPEANRVLAQNRAEAAAQFLRENGIANARLQAEAAPTSVSGGEAQAVSFVVGQLAY